MKIAVLNYSGSVGKTIIASHLLAPRMKGAKIIALETINMSAKDLGLTDVEILKGDKVGELIEMLFLEDSAIIDVGASNVERFLESMSRYEDSQAEFDFFLIPTTSEQKAWQESLKTCEALHEVGVPADKIIFVPNRISDNPETEIPGIYSYTKKTKKARIVDAFVYESEIFGYLTHHKKTFSDLLGDNTDYKSLAKNEPDAEKRAQYAKLYRWCKLAAPVCNNLDRAFEALTGVVK